MPARFLELSLLFSFVARPRVPARHFGYASGASAIAAVFRMMALE